MSVIFGIWDQDSDTLADSYLKSASKALEHWKPDSKGTIQKNSVGFGQLTLFNSPESLHDHGPLNQNECIITADVRLDNRNELCDLLNVAPNEAKNLPDNEILLKTYKKWGKACIDHILGAFAFAIYDHAANIIYCFRDHMGIRPFYYYFKDGVFAFASEIKGITNLPEVDVSVNEQWIADCLRKTISDKHSTYYRHIFRLPAATMLECRQGQVDTQEYWKLDPNQRLEGKNPKEYIELFHDKLTKAINNNLRSSGNVGAELSGGLDSSGIVGIAANLLKKEHEQLHTFTRALSEQDKNRFHPFKDETIYSQKVIESCEIQNAHTLTGTGSILDLLRNALFLYDAPPINSFGEYCEELYSLVENQGVNVLLSGYGGDEMVTSQAHGALSDLVKEGRWKVLWREISARSKRLGRNSLRPFLARIYYEKVTRSASHQKRAELRTRRSESFVINDTFSEKYGAKNNWRDSGTKETYLNLKHQQCDWISYPSTVQRLELSALHGNANRFEYRYPLLDVPLLECYLALPNELKYAKGWGRYIFRQALHNYVPESIRWRPDKEGSAAPYNHKLIAEGKQSLLKYLDEISKTNMGLQYVDLAKMRGILMKIDPEIRKIDGKNVKPTLTALMLLMKYES